MDMIYRIYCAYNLIRIFSTKTGQYLHLCRRIGLIMMKIAMSKDIQDHRILDMNIAQTLLLENIFYPNSIQNVVL